MPAWGVRPARRFGHKAPHDFVTIALSALTEDNLVVNAESITNPDGPAVLKDLFFRVEMSLRTGGWCHEVEVALGPCPEAPASFLTYPCLSSLYAWAAGKPAPSWRQGRATTSQRVGASTQLPGEAGVPNEGETRDSRTVRSPTPLFDTPAPSARWGTQLPPRGYGLGPTPLATKLDVPLWPKCT